MAPSTFAEKPTIERIDIDESSDDVFLTAECGVPVTTRAHGHVIFRTFEGRGTGAAELTTIDLAFTAMSGDNTYRFRDVGADLTRVEPDGTAILMIIGQVPFGFAGVLKIDLETGEAILEPQHSLEGNLDEASAALAARFVKPWCRILGSPRVTNRSSNARSPLRTSRRVRPRGARGAGARSVRPTSRGRRPDGYARAIEPHTAIAASDDVPIIHR